MKKYIFRILHILKLKLKYFLYKDELDKYVITYSMGRVGSKSIKDTLQNYGIRNVYQIHYIEKKDNERNLEFENNLFYNHCYNWTEEMGVKEQVHPLWDRSAECYDLIKSYKEVHIITGVRDPISQAISRFFFNFCKVDLQKYMDYHNCDISNMKDLKSLFLREYDISVPLTWFKEQFFVVTGVNVYDYNFPKEKGVLQIKKDNLKILILKLEAENSVKETAIRSFLDLRNFTLCRKNTIKGRVGSDIDKLYKKFKEEVELPEEYINYALQSKYTKQFYTEDEINDLYQKYSSKILR